MRFTVLVGVRVVAGTPCRQPSCSEGRVARIGPGTRWSGNPSQTSPSSKRPPDFGRAPPHCLKKNATSSLAQMSRSRRAQSGCMGRALGPLSPPTMAHAISRRSTSSIAPRSGSNEMNRASELILLNWVMRLTCAASSTETPKPDMARNRSPTIAPTDIGAHERAALGQHLVDIPVGLLHRIEDHGR